MFLRKSIKIPIYPGKLDIVLTDDHKSFDKVYINSFDGEEIYAHAISTRSKTDNYYHFVIVLNFNTHKSVNKIDHGVISHECLHITSFIMDYIDYDFDPNNHEPFAYLLQWVTNEVYNFLDQQKIIVSLKNIK